MSEGRAGNLDLASTAEPAVPRRAHRRVDAPSVQAACRRVLAVLDGLERPAQLRVLQAAALLLGPDEAAAP